MKGWSVSVFGAIAAICVLLSVASIWLFLTDPVTVVKAVNQGEISPFIQNLATVIFDALWGLLKYL